MSPDPVKCPDCGSTQIGHTTKGGGTRSSMGMMTEQGAMAMMHNTRDGTFYNVCQACGHEWSPAEAMIELEWVVFQEGLAKKKEAHQRFLAARKAIFIPWRKKLLKELSPFLGVKKKRFPNG